MSDYSEEMTKFLQTYLDEKLPNTEALGSHWSTLFSPVTGVTPSAIQFQDELTEARKKLQDVTKKLELEKADKNLSEINRKEVEGSLQRVLEKEKIAFLLSRVTDEAQERLLTDSAFQNKFLSEGVCNAFVVAVDIRRSTELMLKARTPQHFATFIRTICQELEGVIKDSLGVFDKFTGDGVLAFFPDFYSGEDAGIRAVEAAQKCLEAFDLHYKQHRNSFSTVLKDVGLGIGIDYGSVNLLRAAGGLTVVGSPVVYACRLSSAPAGHIYLNQPAFENVSSKYGRYCHIDETELEIKHEGSVLCYDVRLTNPGYQAAKAPWQTVQTRALDAKDMKSQATDAKPENPTKPANP